MQTQKPYRGFARTAADKTQGFRRHGYDNQSEELQLNEPADSVSPFIERRWHHANDGPGETATHSRCFPYGGVCQRFAEGTRIL
jgi:hypothetical protein